MISIIIVEYNSIDEMRHCTAAIADKLQTPYEVIVSSNSCYDEAVRTALNAEDIPHVHWIFNERNGGFAYAMNQGLRKAQGDYLVIMNSDCTLETDLSPLVHFFEKHPEVGAVGPQLRDKNGNVQDTARPYVSVLRFALRQFKRVLLHRECVLEARMDYSQVQTVDWVIGAFIMVTRRAFELTGGLDERYFMYAEDLDWCTRIREKGLEVVYYPQVQVRYRGTRRARSNSKYAKIFYQSHLRYWLRFGFFFGYPKRRRIVFDNL